jgi:conserved oligomeric Golgi complex subunit 3
VSSSPVFIQDVPQTAQMHLLYTRFRSVSAPLSPLLGELERRTNAHPEELSALLAECHSAYFSARKGLLVSKLVEEIKGLDPGRTELVELVSYFIYLFLW